MSDALRDRLKRQRSHWQINRLKTEAVQLEKRFDKALQKFKKQMASQCALPDPATAKKKLRKPSNQQELEPTTKRKFDI